MEFDSRSDQVQFQRDRMEHTLTLLETLVGNKTHDAKKYYSSVNARNFFDFYDSAKEKEFQKIKEENNFLIDFFKEKLGFIHLTHPRNSDICFSLVTENTLNSMLTNAAPEKLREGHESKESEDNNDKFEHLVNSLKSGIYCIWVVAVLYIFLNVFNYFFNRLKFIDQRG